MSAAAAAACCYLLRAMRATCCYCSQPAASGLLNICAWKTGVGGLAAYADVRFYFMNTLVYDRGGRAMEVRTNITTRVTAQTAGSRGAKKSPL